MITVERVTQEQIRAVPRLLDEYADEVGFAELGPPNPQWDIYAAMEAAGVWIGVGVFADGVLAGFASVIVSILPHFGVRAATMESLFVGKQYRRKGAGTRLLAAAKAAAKLAGCKLIFYHAPAGSQLEKLLGKRCTRTGSVFCEAL